MQTVRDIKIIYKTSRKKYNFSKSIRFYVEFLFVENIYIVKNSTSKTDSSCPLQPLIRKYIGFGYNL